MRKDLKPLYACDGNHGWENETNEPEKEGWVIGSVAKNHITLRIWDRQMAETGKVLTFCSVICATDFAGRHLEQLQQSTQTKQDELTPQEEEQILNTQPTLGDPKLDPETN